MMKFKDIVRDDRNAFFNFSEFEEKHRIRYKIGIEQVEKELWCIQTHGVRAKTQAEKVKSAGLFIGYENLYCRSEDLDVKPRQGTLIYIDETRYTVTSIEEQQGVTRLQMEGYHQ